MYAQGNSMKRCLLPAALALLLPGCGFLNKTLGTAMNAAGGVVNTVTRPVSGVLNLSDASENEDAWRTRLDQLKSERQSALHDRRRPQAKRPQ